MKVSSEEQEKLRAISVKQDVLSFYLRSRGCETWSCLSQDEDEVEEIFTAAFTGKIVVRSAALKSRLWIVGLPRAIWQARDDQAIPSTGLGNKCTETP